MRIAVVTACLAIMVAAAPARAERETFLSPGVSIGYGARGWVFGAEVSIVSGTSPMVMGGGAFGIELASSAPEGAPWGRVYLEGEASLTFFGSGFGPALLFGGGEPQVQFQMTPYAVLTKWIDSIDRHCYLPLLIPYYRFTTGEVPLHEAGAFAKVAMHTSCMM